MHKNEVRALQIAVAIGSSVPIVAGITGVLLGPQMPGATSVVSVDLDSHFRYLSGLLLAIGIGFASTVPCIERHQLRFRLLATFVVVGGIGRLLSLPVLGLPSPAMQAALAMELVVTPALALWQRRVARRAAQVD